MNDMTTLRASVEDGALTITAHGVVTKETMQLARTELLRAAYGTPLDRVLFDFSKAVLLLTAGAWEEFAERGLSAEFLPIPSAILVPHANIGDAWNFCDRLNAHGRRFVAFTSAQRALWWVRGQPERRRASREETPPPLSPSPSLPGRRRTSEPRD